MLNPHCVRIIIDVYWTHFAELCEAAKHLCVTPSILIDELLEKGGKIAKKSKNDLDFLTRLDNAAKSIKK